MIQTRLSVVIQLILITLLAGCSNSQLFGTYEGAGFDWHYTMELEQNNRFEFEWRAGLARGVTKGTWIKGENEYLYLTSEVQESDSMSFEWWHENMRYRFFSNEKVRLDRKHLLIHVDSITQQSNYKLKKK